MGYNLAEPHKKMVSRGMPSLIIQAGHVYEHGSRKHIGKVEDIKDRLVGKTGNVICPLSGGTFTSKEALEKHLMTNYRDALVSIASKRAPKNIQGVWSPDEQMIKEEASKLAGTVRAVHLEKKHTEKESPNQNHRESAK